MRRWLFRWFVLATLLFCSSAVAAPRSAQVLVIQSEQAVSQAQALTAALKAALKDLPDWELASGDYSLEVMTLALGCEEPPNAECLARIAEKIQASAFVWGNMTLTGEELIVSLHLWERGAPDREVNLRYSSKLSDSKDAKLRRIAREALRKLTAKSEPEKPSPPKTNTVAKKASGSLATDTSADFTAHDVDRSERSNLLAYSALAVGALAVGGGIYSAVRVNQIDQSSEIENYRNAFSPNRNICEEAARGTVVQGAASPGKIEDLCHEAHRFELFEYVLFGVGALGIGTGTVLLLTNSSNNSEQSARRAQKLVPHVRVSSKGVAASLRLSF